MPFQSQAPPAKSGGGGSGGKTEAELKEEEELQLAIALSQSEAQAKEDAKRRGHHSTSKFSSEVTHTEKPPQQKKLFLHLICLIGYVVVTQMIITFCVDIFSGSVKVTLFACINLQQYHSSAAQS